MNLWAVIPAQDEEKTISHVIDMCLWAGSAKVMVVLNGSQDATERILKRRADARIGYCKVDEPLGLDIPRCVGAFIAYREGAESILFCDGDLSGEITGHLASLYGSMTWGYDLSLSDCYPKGLPGTGMAGKVVSKRLNLNRVIGREDLEAAIMSHGPSCISRRFLDALPVEVLGIPPMAQALAVKKGLTVKVGGVIPHGYLGSKERHGDHPDGIAELIIGDCIAAASIYAGGLPARCDEDGVPHIGFARFRRWDVLPRLLRKIADSGFIIPPH